MIRSSLGVSEMCFRQTSVCLWLTVSALLLSEVALAQTTSSPTSLINTVQCTALTVLAPDPQKVSQDVVMAAAAAAAVKAAMAAGATQASTELAAKATAKAVTPETFKIPQPKLMKGATAEWGSRIEVTFDPVESLVAKCLESDLTLFLDHYPLTGLTPVERIRDDRGMVTLAFRVNRPVTSSAGWTELLAKLWATDGIRTVTVGVGLGSTQVGVAKEKLKLTLGIGGPRWAWGALFGSILLLASLWRWSKLLQDRRDGYMSYSVSRLLLSLWVLTTISAVLLMVLRIGAMPSATESGFVFMLAISGATTGFSALIDLIRKPTNPVETRFWEDFFDDADGLALHRVQVVFFNLLVLYIVWRDLIQLGTVARIDAGWAVLMGASAMTFVFGKSGESTRPSIAPVVSPPRPKTMS